MGSLPDEVTDAAGRGDEAALLAWLDRGGQINAIDGANSDTALMNAAYFGHERVVEVLLQRGAEINKQSSHGDTALMIAAQERH